MPNKWLWGLHNDKASGIAHGLPTPLATVLWSAKATCVPMTRTEQAIRSRLAFSVAISLLGIVLGVYDVELLAGIVSIAGIAYLGLSIHQFGRLGEDV